MEICKLIVEIFLIESEQPVSSRLLIGINY